MSVYIIAEAGVNHNGSLEIAMKMVDAAKSSGCNCIKFQTFNTDKIVTQEAKKAEYQVENTKSENSQYEMLKKLELSYEEFGKLKKYCRKVDIDFLSTPFDEDAVDFLEEIGVSQYKIPSGELTNKPLIQYIAKKGKNILLSTGMADLEEVREAIGWIKETGNEKIILFHCTSNYPAPYEDVNMNAMLTLKQEFSLPVGYSDHTAGNEIAYMSVAMGAVMLEKHFTLSRNMEGPDHKASLEPLELNALVAGVRKIEKAFGTEKKSPTKSELSTRFVARKSLVYTKNLEPGHCIEKGDIVCKRPGTGIPPKYMDGFWGKKILQNCKKDTLVKFDDIGDEQ